LLQEKCSSVPLDNEEDQIISQFSKRSGLIARFIILPTYSHAFPIANKKKLELPQQLNAGRLHSGARRKMKYRKFVLIQKSMISR